jgi:siroheme synthase (precorrin-2 oxidase/ferrochelatase)
MGHYPIFLELAGRSCLVIGGGLVAERKVKGLLRAGASVTVLSPTLTWGGNTARGIWPGISLPLWPPATAR